MALGRMMWRSAWQTTSYFCCLNDSNSLMCLTDQTLYYQPTESKDSSASFLKDFLGSRECECNPTA